MGRRRGILSAVFTPLARRQTYKNLSYMLLAIPLGVSYWSLFGFGITFGVLSVIIGIGVFLLLGIVLGSRLAAHFERWLTVWLLGVEIPAPQKVRTADGTIETIRVYLEDPFTWRGLAFVSLKSWLALVGFVLLFGFVQAVSMVSAVFGRPQQVSFGEVNGEPVVWTVETLPEVALAVGAGSLLVVVLLHLSNGFAYATGCMARALLGGNE